MSREEMLAAVEKFIEDVLDSLHSDPARFNELTSGDIEIKFNGATLLLPINADTVSALEQLLRDVEY